MKLHSIETYDSFAYIYLKCRYCLSVPLTFTEKCTRPLTLESWISTVKTRTLEPWTLKEPVDVCIDEEVPATRVQVLSNSQFPANHAYHNNVCNIFGAYTTAIDEETA